MTEKNKFLPEIPELNTDTEEQQFARNLFGLFETVSAVPTAEPINYLDQIKIYVNGATLRLYWYDKVAHVWHYVTATA